MQYAPRDIDGHVRALPTIGLAQQEILPSFFFCFCFSFPKSEQFQI
jgi:hypothetical protein